MRTDMVVDKWIKTDDDQWLRQAEKEDKFEMLQIYHSPTGEYFVTFNYMDMCDITPEEWHECLSAYGYGGDFTPGSLGVEFLDFDTQIAAECYLEYNPDYEAKFEGTREECEAYVNKVIAYLNKNPMYLEELEEDFYRIGNSFLDNME